MLENNNNNNVNNNNNNNDTDNNNNNNNNNNNIIIIIIIDSNWTEWSTNQGVISKSEEREARGRFENTSAITP